MLKRKTFRDSPDYYRSFEAALAWAHGYNAAVAEQEANNTARKADMGDVGFHGHLVRSDWWHNSPLSPNYRRYGGRTVRASGMLPELAAGYGEVPRNVSARIKDYLTSGGLFNPELANHQAVRDLLIDALDTLEALKVIANR